MKIKDKSTIQFIESLIETNYLNMSLSDMFSEIVGARDITSKEEMNALKNKFNNNEIDILASKCFSYWGLDEDNEEDLDIFNSRILPSFSEINVNKYRNNPYYKSIKLAYVKEGDYSIEVDHFEPYEIFAYKDMSINENYEEINSLSFFKEKFPFLSINYKGTTWMSVTPNEIETMEKAVNEATGKVIVYGLGLGYFPYMISLKDEVKEIVIVEIDKEIISLFKKHLLPQFEHKEKITIINKDAFIYMQESHSFDYSFIDLWHDPYDGIELYLKAKRLEKENQKYFYWLESSFYILLRRCFISFLEEQLSNAPESSYQKSKSITDKIINTFYQKTKNLVITNIEQLQDLLSDSSLINLLQ